MKQPPKVLLAPKAPSNLPDTACWLAGEGAGSWFVIEPEEGSSEAIIKRYSPKGVLECEGLFKANNDLEIKEYSIIYPSHCAEVTIKQKNETITFNYVKPIR